MKAKGEQFIKHNKTNTTEAGKQKSKAQRGRDKKTEKYKGNL